MIRDHKQMISAVTDEFAVRFGNTDVVKVGMAPGRVNLIGEYTDFNEGFVFPMTVDRGVYIAATARSDQLVRLWSTQYDAGFEGQLDDHVAPPPGSWPCYVIGVARELASRGLISKGFDAVIDGNLDLQAGLSSSAALEVATAVSLRSIFEFELDQIALVKLCHHVEHHYAQVFCGVMDQFACGMGAAGHALFLDCRSLAFENVPAFLGDYRFVIVNTGVKRALASSAYNDRRAECDEAVQCLITCGIDAQTLRDISVEQLSMNDHALPSLIAKRARHVVTENQRVLNAVTALKSDDLISFGRLMYESHESLSNNFEVSCEELDFIVDYLREFDTVLGARMTGAGFGGCAVALLAAEAVDDVIQGLSFAYHRRFNVSLTTLTLNTNLSAGLVAG